jgi:transcriptional regulator with XRE-family HTH domain
MDNNIPTKDLTTFQLRGARKALGITLKQIAEGTGIAVSSLARMESGNVFLFPEHSSVPTVYAVRNFLESQGIRFLPGNGLQLVNPDEKIQIRIVPTN